MYANNDMTSAMSIAALRARYKINAFDMFDPAVKDLNIIEMCYYGKVTGNGLPISPKEESLVALSQGAEFINSSQHLVLPFVKEMHAAMRRNIQIKMAVGSLPTSNAAIGRMEPIKSYVSPEVLYNSYFNGLMIEFNTSYLTLKDIKNITSYKSYVKYLIRYFNELPIGTPITFSGWGVSNYNSIFTTGLAISILNNKYHDDETNTLFINNSMFSYYKKLAMSYGFCVVKQAPWILVADLNSPAIKRMYKNGINGHRGVISNYFNLNYNNDLNILINNIIMFYNNFVLLNSTERNINVTCNNRTIIRSFERNPIDSTDPIYINKRKYMSIYCHLRNREEGNPFSPYVLSQMLKRTQNSFDILGSLGYVNKRFAAELFKKPYGYANSIQRFKKREMAKKGIAVSTKSVSQKVITGGSGGGY